MLESLSPEQFSEVTENTSRWLARSQVLLHQKMPSALDWRRLEVPCPFLKNGRCSVYARRPSGCRTFFALNDPDNCKMPAREHQLFTKLNPEEMASLSWPFIEAAKKVTMDHLGVFLARKLLQTKVRSGATKSIHPLKWIRKLKRQAGVEETGGLALISSRIVNSPYPQHNRY